MAEPISWVAASSGIIASPLVKIGCPAVSKTVMATIE